MNLREVFADVAPQPDENRPLRLSDIQDKKELPDRYTEHSAVVAGASLVSLVGLVTNRPAVPSGMLSAETTAVARDAGAAHT